MIGIMAQQAVSPTCLSLPLGRVRLGLKGPLVESRRLGNMRLKNYRLLEQVLILSAKGGYLPT
jgi:hypothetical protein